MERETHGGDLVLSAAQAHGVNHIFTLSGAHVFPIYDAAVANQVPIIDVRHEQSAVFAAEATARLERTPGLAVVTAGPGVTNGVSATANAFYNGAPLLLLGGRAPDARWGMGALQEIDQPPLLKPITKSAITSHSIADLEADTYKAFEIARTPHRGPTFLDIPMDVFFSPGIPKIVDKWQEPTPHCNSTEVSLIADLVNAAVRPLLILGSDVWAGRAEREALAFAENSLIPVITNGTARGIIPRGHQLLATKARSYVMKNTDLVIVVGTPLDFRLGYGDFGSARVIHIMDENSGIAKHVSLAASTTGDFRAIFQELTNQIQLLKNSDWITAVKEQNAKGAARDQELLLAEGDLIHPARIYGELLPHLSDDTVVIGDGGDFVSFAGKFIEPAKPGCWLDPGPFGCLGGGMGGIIAARLARPDSPIVALFGDGALGFALSELDTLVRHQLPALIIVGNNSAWGLEKHPMQSIFGYDVAADLAPQTRYDHVASALGGAAELITSAKELGPAIKRGLTAGVPYLLNVITDTAIAYPRTTTGI